MSDLATRLRTACDQVRVKSYPLSDLIPLMQQAADALAAAPRQPAPSAAPGGFAVVPMDATDNMMAAFAKTAAAEIDWHSATEIERQEVRDGFGPAYRAMLAAAPQSSPTPQAYSAPGAICNACGADLLEVKQSPNSYLSAEQFDADKLGDWYCKCCPKGPSEGSSTHRYFWNRDLGASAPQADSQPAPVADNLRALFREALAWGMTYGPEIPAHQWDEMRESMVEQYVSRAARAPADSVLEDAARLERERICAAIKADDDYCVENGDYMLDSNDCINIMRAKWVRPDYSVDAARKQGANHD